VGQALFIFFFFPNFFLPLAPQKRAGKKEGVWGGNFCQRPLSATGGVSVGWGIWRRHHYHYCELFPSKKVRTSFNKFDQKMTGKFAGHFF